MKTITSLGLVFGILASVSCGTVSGVGQDVQSVGKGISRGAGAVQKEIRR